MNFVDYKRFSFFALVAVITMVIAVGHFLNLSYEKPSKDGSHYVAYAYNSLKYGIYDYSRSERPSPDYRREPGYPLWLMAGMIIHPTIDLKTQDANCIVRAEGNCLEIITYLKIGNIILLMATALLSGYFVYLYSKNILASGICYFLIAFSGSLGYFTSRFYSEPLATFLVVAGSFSLYNLTQNGFTRRRAFLCGLLLASLALTKAIFYYLIYLCCILLFIWWISQGIGVKNSFKRILFFLLGAFILLGPWIIRNYIQIGTFSIAGRAGLNLTVRANYDEASKEEYRALILMYAPKFKWVRQQSKTYVDSAMREKLKGYVQRAYSRRDQLKSELHLEDPELDQFLFNEAKQRIVSNFVNHLALVLPVALRGSGVEVGYGFNPKNSLRETIGIKTFGVDVSKLFISTKLIPNIVFIVAFFGAFFLSLLFRNWGLAWFLIPSMYSFGMYSFFTHFEYRFNLPSIPIYAICVSILMRKTYRLLHEQVHTHRLNES
jgi:4-amino-4-deoxy-L-arabinose transferase-like glycosyltransferase